MKLLKKISIILISVTAISGLGVGVVRAKHSELFTLQTIEVRSSVDDPPIDDQSIIKLTSVPIGKVSLFELNLEAIERRLLTNDWIREVRLQKEALHTLIVSIVYREPKAIIQPAVGGLSYVDAEGKIFGTANLLHFSDLPLLMGFSDQPAEKLREALRLLDRWEELPVHQVSSISSVHWESERGFRALALYSLGGGDLDETSGKTSRVRTMIDFGQEIDTDIDDKLSRLLNVFRYLRRNAIPVHQVWADNGKKVVVKTVHGS